MKDVMDITEWIGRTKTHEGMLSLETAQMLHATLCPPEAASPRAGDKTPSLWHWAAFTPKVTMAQVGDDGHPARGGFLPPVDLPRRMWAGGSVQFHSALHTGRRWAKTSTIRDVQQKSAEMVFVTVAHEIREGGILCVSEVQNIVYLPIPDRYSPPKARAVPDTAEFIASVDTGSVTLFRYSAATFNGHRIHYDLPYAQNVERYPGLVVHGPLQATWLIAAAEQHGGRRARSFDYRGVHPVFHDDNLHLYGFDMTPEGMALCTGIPGSHQGMQANITWETS